jgi:hypothetical protein
MTIAVLNREIVPDFPRKVAGRQRKEQAQDSGPFGSLTRSVPLAANPARFCPVRRRTNAEMGGVNLSPESVSFFIRRLPPAAGAEYRIFRFDS